MPVPHSFGTWLKQRRKALDLTQDELAERVGCAAETIRKIEADQRRPSREIAERIAAAVAGSTEERETMVRAARGLQPIEVPPVSSPLVVPDPIPTLPVPPTPLIGRHQEMSHLLSLMSRPDVRCVTLTGPGGSGKTRLSLQAASELSTSFADGVFFVNLALISEPDQVSAMIAQALGIQEVGGHAVLHTLKNYLRDKQQLLVLDNFEQVIEAAPIVSALLAVAPRLKVLVTSRFVLHLSGEHEYPVPPLAVPDLKRLPSLAELSHYPAVTLFVQRAQAVRSDFQLTAAKARDVAEICVRLDGLPLAIELAAARARLFQPQALLRRLDNRLTTLTGGPKDLAARQQTLRSLMDWSVGLLDGREKLLFQRVAVFVGGWSLEAAQAVCTVDGDLQGYALDGLQSLVDKSLVLSRDGPGDEPRFTMLETIREYALELLAADPHQDVLLAQRTAYFVGRVEAMEDNLFGGNRAPVVAQLELEHDNLRSVLEHVVARRDVDGAARLAGSLWFFWILRSYYHEGRTWLERTLDLARSMEPLNHPAVAKVLCGIGVFAWLQGNTNRAVRSLSESVALFREQGDRRRLAYALGCLAWASSRQAGSFARACAVEGVALMRDPLEPWGLAFALLMQGQVALNMDDLPEARRLFEQSVDLFQELGDTWGHALALDDLANIALREDDLRSARAQFEASVAIYRGVGDSRALAYNLINLGNIAADQDQHELALTHYAEALTLAQEVGTTELIAWALVQQAVIICRYGDQRRARELLLRSLRLSQDLLDADYIAHSLEGLAAVLVTQGGALPAGHLLGAAERLHQREGGTILQFDPTWQRTYARILEAARSQLDDQQFLAAWHEGRTMTQDAACVYALKIAPTVG